MLRFPDHIRNNPRLRLHKLSLFSCNSAALMASKTFSSSFSLLPLTPSPKRLSTPCKRLVPYLSSKPYSKNHSLSLRTNGFSSIPSANVSAPGIFLIYSIILCAFLRQPLFFSLFYLEGLGLALLFEFYYYILFLSATRASTKEQACIDLLHVNRHCLVGKKVGRKIGGREKSEVREKERTEGICFFWLLMCFRRGEKWEESKELRFKL